MLKQITKIFSLFSKWFTNKQTKTEICLSQQKEFQRILGEQEQGGQGKYLAPQALLSDMFIRVD